LNTTLTTGATRTGQQATSVCLPHGNHAVGMQLVLESRTTTTLKELPTLRRQQGGEQWKAGGKTLSGNFRFWRVAHEGAFYTGLQGAYEGA